MTVTRIESRFMNAEQVAIILGISKSSAYRIIKRMNKELEDKGKIIVAGKISKRYFNEKVYI